jgi:ABC-type Na+ efflux pump permease subunit
MLRRLWTSLRRDNLINLRNHFYTVQLLVAVIYVVTVWLTPETLSVKPDVYLADLTADGRFAAHAQQEAPAPGTTGELFLLDSAEAVQQALQENRSSVGIVLREGADSPLPQVSLYFQGHENAKVRNLLAVAVEDELRELYQQPWQSTVAVQVEQLRGGAARDISLREMLVPILLFSDAGMVGLMFIAALVFMEKEEGTLRAYLVTPGRVWEYLLSKALTLAWIAILFTLILVPVTIGLGANYLHLLAIIVLGSLMTSLFGAAIAVYFDNFTQFLLPMIGIVMIIGLPAMAYFMPGFSPLWMRWLPTYPFVFGLREAVFPSGNPQIVYTALLVLAGTSAVLLALGSLSFKRQLVYR